VLPHADNSLDVTTGDMLLYHGTLLAADYFAMGKTDAKFISEMKRIAER